MDPEKIVIEVRGGVVVAVHALHPLTTVQIKDWDNENDKHTAEAVEIIKDGFDARMSEDYHRVL